MVYLRIVVVTTCLFFKINAYSVKMKEHYDCSRFLNSTRLATHADLCLMTTKCTEHVIRYQTTVDIAKHHISCCKAYQQHYLESHCTLNCKIKCDSRYPKCKNYASQCTCKPGYELHPSQNVCIPQCPSSCPYKCTKPNVCDCPEGYHLSDTETECIPECPNTCGNGYCKYPNECTCLPGYHRSGNGCVPDCFDSCTSSNGTCSRIPNVCECANKFDKVTRKCILCAVGYYYDTRLEICRPKCDKVCENGFCVAPNQCECHIGYVVNNKTKVCEWVRTTTENGVNGTITEVDEIFQDFTNEEVEEVEEVTKDMFEDDEEPSEPVFGASGPLLTVHQYPWLIIFCTAALIASVLLVGVETCIHRMCNRTVQAVGNDSQNDYFNDVQYRWVKNNLYIQKPPLPEI